MLIDTFQPGWEADLNRRHASLPAGANLILLIDGAFTPRLFQQLNGKCKPILLFDLLSSCSDDARDVSPFVVSYDPTEKSLQRVLKRCNRWPMLSALTSYESAEQLAERLAAWCIVKVDGQDFNFRFPDTRRLPAIFETLAPHQRAELLGSAFEWHYISRDGNWHSLPLESSTVASAVSGKASLTGDQFGKLLSDSDPDEMWVQLLDRGAQTDLAPSQRHALIRNALHVANKIGLDEAIKIAWCMECINASDQRDLDSLLADLKKWKQENFRSNNES